MVNPKTWLILILVLATFLRFIYPNQVPPSLNWDEASLGYNAYSILKTGRDEWGRFLPLSFEAFGDYKLPGYIYSTAASIAMFGLSENVVRLPSRLAGIISVLLLYLIVKKLTNKESLSLLASALLAISPTGIFLSRMAVEANLAFSLFLVAFYFFLRGLEKPSFLTVSSIFMGLSLFTYNSARVFIPIFLIGIIFFYQKKLQEIGKKLAIPGIISAIFFSTAIYLAIFQDSSARFYWVTILDQGAINFLNEARSSSKLPDQISALVYNRGTYFTGNFVINLLKNISVDFLFLSGGSNHQFSVPNTGLMYIIELPLLIVGLFAVFKKRLLSKVLLLWLLAAIIPSSITREAPHVLRSIFMLGSLQIITAFGLVYLLEGKRGFNKKIITVFIPLIYISLSSVYLYQYFFVYPKNNSEAWQYGMKQVFNYLDSIDDGQTVYITKKYGEPHIFYLFFRRYDPATYQKNPTLVRYAQTNWRWVDRIDNIHFINDWEIKNKFKARLPDGQVQSLKFKVLLVTSPGNYPNEANLVKSIYFLDGRKAFDVVQL